MAQVEDEFVTIGREMLEKIESAVIDAGRLLHLARSNADIARAQTARSELHKLATTWRGWIC